MNRPKTRPVVWTVARALLVALLVVTASAASALERPEFVAGELIIKFRADQPEAARTAFLDRFELRERRTLRGTGAQLVEIPAVTTAELMRDTLRTAPEIEYADLNYFRYLDGIPNDSRFDELWGMHNTGQSGGVADADIDAPEAWDIETGSDQVVVAVLDSGVDMQHVDIAANLYTNPGEIPGNGVDDDGNGFVDDLHGWDFRDNDNDPSPTGGLCVGHGTHTAGTVGAVGDNGVGVTGVAHQVKLMPLRAFYIQLFILCTAQDSDLIDAIGYIGDMGVPISNHSWGGGGFSNAMEDAIRRSRHLFVNSAGNGNLFGVGFDIDDSPVYPASYDLDNIVVVASTTDRDERSRFSNWGNLSVDLAAPGSGILSTKPDDAYGYLDGTSMAAPHVAGAAALLLSQEPTATTAELKNRLMRGTDPVPVDSQTDGRLNAFNSLTLPASEVVADLTPLGPTDVAPGDTIDYNLALTNTVGEARTVEVSVRIWAPTGGEITIVGPADVTLSAGQAVDGDLAITLPGNAPAGDYRLIARVDDRQTSFDEDRVVYDVN